MHLGGTCARVFKKLGSCGGPEVSQTLDFGFVVTFSNPPYSEVFGPWTKKLDLGLLFLRGHKNYIAQGLTVFGPD